AEQENAEARAIYERFAPSSAQAASSQDAAGNLDLQRGDAGAAGRFFEQALAIWHKWAPQSTSEAASLHGLARVARARGDEVGATRLFCEAVDALDQQRTHV